MMPGGGMMPGDGMMPGGMGFPSGMNVPNVADDPELLYKAARQLWDPGVATVVGQRLAAVSSLKEDSQLVALARTMPLDGVRAGLFAMLQARFQDGPESLISASGMSGGGMMAPRMMRPAPE